MITGSRIERKKYRKKKSSSQNNNNKPRKSKHLIRHIFVTMIAIFFGITIIGASIFGYYAMKAPELTESDLQGQIASKIYDRRGTMIRELGGQNRELMTPDEIPDNLKAAVLTVEDSRFYQHKGIDPIRIVGAALANLRSADIVQGGSTITQQLIKLSVFSTDFKDQTIERKAQEAWLALQIEQTHSKEEILTLYLNKLYYSNNIYGVKTAAETFFGKPLSQINLAEAALLAGIPQAPANYDPYAFPKEAKKRRDLVLDIMLENNLITKDQHDQAVNTSIESMLIPFVESMEEVNLAYDAYLDVVAKEVKETMNLNIYTDGLDIYTNMDSQAQQYLYDLVNDDTRIAFPNDKLQTAVSIVDVHNGELQAVLGGRKQDFSMGLNRADDLNRSVGSTIKPLVDYGPAFEYLNYSTGTLVVDEPYKYSNGATIENYDFDFKGNQTVREALAGSRNIPALKLLQNVGLDNAYAFLQKMDINLLNNNKRELVEANAIGGEISPIQLSAAYATIANYGEYHKPFSVKKVVTSAGTERKFETEIRQAMKDSTAYMLVDILKGVPGEFAEAAKVDGLYQAGKTGTTNYTDDQLKQIGVNNSTFAAPDGWFAGMTPQYSLAAWVGYDNPYEQGHYLTLEQSRIPQQIYAEMMRFMMRDKTISDWHQPESVVKAEIEKYTDPIKSPGPNTPSSMRSSELFIKGTEPSETSLAYGRTLNPPTGFNAVYDDESKLIQATWNPSSEGMFELSVNDQVVYTGNGTTFSIPANPQSNQNFVLRLRIIDGNSASDSIVITINLTTEESSNESESENEQLSENQLETSNHFDENHSNRPNEFEIGPSQQNQPLPPTNQW